MDVLAILMREVFISCNPASSNYLFANTREFEHSVGDLIPDTEYEFSVQTIVEGVTSGYSVAVRNTTLSESMY